jgi:protein tyrosine/serine phosphatase
MEPNSRHVVFEACFNFRDLGGYPTVDERHLRWGTLYRSDTLHRLTVADVEAFRQLGLRTVIDLRSSTEIDQYGRLGISDDGLTWHNIPMLDNVQLSPRDPSDPLLALPPEESSPGEGYVRIAEEFAASIAATFRILAGEDTLPAVFHCTSGKDRTGIVAALLLDVLGVADEVIGADYCLTEAAQVRSTPWIEQHEPEFAAFLAQIPPERRAPRPERILDFLDGLRARYGSVQEFLQRSGVAERELNILRARVVQF